MSRQKRWFVVWSVVAAAALTGCGTFGGKHKVPAAAAPPEEAAVTAPTMADNEAELRRVVESDLTAAAQEKKDVIERRRPYYFKEYGEYPDPTNLKVSMEEKDSRVVPYEAEVIVPKIRFATKLHREREAAAADDHYYRGTGLETLTYQYRGEHWVRAGSLFVADKVEENVNGEWLPVVENLESTIATEEPSSDGWLGHAWSALVGK